MIQHILHTIGGIEHYGILSLCLFSFIFLCVFTWACLLRNTHLERMSRLPLETEESNPGEPSHE